MKRDELILQMRNATGVVIAFWEQAEALERHIGSFLSEALSNASRHAAHEFHVQAFRTDSLTNDKTDSLTIVWATGWEIRLKRPKQKKAWPFAEARLVIRIAGGGDPSTAYPIEPPYIGWAVDSGEWDQIPTEEFEIDAGDWTDAGYQEIANGGVFPSAARQWIILAEATAGAEPDFGVAAVFCPLVLNDVEQIRSMMVEPAVAYLCEQLVKRGP